ncbi:MAG: response regulator [Myxococcaceae bacterium]
MPLDVPHDASKRVLVVDDEPVVCDVVSRLLVNEGLMVDQAESAEHALELLRNHRYALLVADKNLPKMSGLQLVAVARQQQPFIESVVITGFPSPESLLWAFAAGASDYLTKPFADLRVTRAKLKAAVARFSRRASGAAETSVAREAAEVIMNAPHTPRPALDLLQGALKRYEAAIAEPSGTVALEGPSQLAPLLRQSGLLVVEPPTQADVVLVPSAAADWRERVRALKAAAQPPTVVLVAEPGLGLDELLEALDMAAEIAPAPQSDPNALTDRVKALLSQKGVERAQEGLVRALQELRAAA